MKKKKKNKALAVTVTVLIVSFALAYLLFSSFGETMIYYKTVDELLAEADKWEDRQVRINGVLVPGSVRNRPGTSEFRFQMSKRGQVIDVDYNGILPDAMKDGEDLMVQGELAAGDRLFKANEILTKCPSKYEEQAAAIAP